MKKKEHRWNLKLLYKSSNDPQIERDMLNYERICADFAKKYDTKEKAYLTDGKDSPENILREIGIDVSKPGFWKEGLKEIEDDINKLEKLTTNKK